ncbi:MAG: J domain-containing protein [Proteobacteria bacterium]|nr:J domain-containing protein [Pseudomonadota bacterium]
MDIKKCFELLDLDREASPDQARQAYKDLVAIWHPDRFGGNPRLRQKAEEKLKEINRAYEGVKAYFSRVYAEGPGRKSGPDPERRGTKHEKSADPERRDRTEEAAEAGTRMVLYAWYYLSKALRGLSTQADEAKGASGQDGVDAPDGQEARKRGGRGNDAGGAS